MTTSDLDPDALLYEPMICGVFNHFGCGKLIEHPNDLYRCTDCTLPFHRECAKRHFGKGDGNKHMPHHYASQVAWAVEQIIEARATIAKLEAEGSALAAGQCIVTGGLVGDEYGNQICTRNTKLTAREPGVTGKGEGEK